VPAAEQKGHTPPEPHPDGPPTKPPRKTATRRAPAKTKAKPLEVGISYSYDVKANLAQGSYESAGVHITKSERWSVEGMTPAAATKFWNERYEALKAEIDPLVEAEYKELSCFASKDEPEGDDR
jgi:hypothetical protein